MAVRSVPIRPHYVIVAGLGFIPGASYCFCAVAWLCDTAITKILLLGRLINEDRHCAKLRQGSCNKCDRNKQQWGGLSRKPAKDMLATNEVRSEERDFAGWGDLV